ncbi:MAG: 2-deoxy-5-keto-D-gluconate 6-phosphate aldolase domain-containing protein, partial [Solirubrobacteraceae bacterium]
MQLGYDKPLFILAFDHRGSFQKKFFGIDGEASPEEVATIANAKHLIFEGLERATGQGVDVGSCGALIDEQFGSTVPEEARRAAVMLAMPVERSGQPTFDFEYGEDFAAHIERFDPDFSKVLVRYNPDGDAASNREQLTKLRRLADWLHDPGAHATETPRRFLFELLVPAEEHQLAAAGGDTD